MQVDEVAQLRRYLTLQVVQHEVQLSQAGEVAQLRGYLSAQIVLREVQPSDTTVGANRNSMPFEDVFVA